MPAYLSDISSFVWDVMVLGTAALRNFDLKSSEAVPVMVRGTSPCVRKRKAPRLRLLAIVKIFLLSTPKALEGCRREIATNVPQR